MLRTNSVIGMAVLTMVLVGLSMYAWPQQPSPTLTSPVEKITFGTVASSLFPALVWVAEHEGYFQHTGLDVEIRGSSSAHVALKTMLEEGTLDIVGVAQTPVVFHSFARSDYAIIATMADSDNNHKLLARKDRGIHTPADLKGKVVGITKGASGQFFLDMFLLTQGDQPCRDRNRGPRCGSLDASRHRRPRRCHCDLGATYLSCPTSLRRQRLPARYAQHRADKVLFGRDQAFYHPASRGLTKVL